MYLTKKSNEKIMEKKNKKSDNYIVGIGASAGGLEALQKFLTALPSDTGLSFIIVQHLSPDYKSLLSEILSKYTDMSVFQVESGMEIHPNCVYVIQPGKNMRISAGKLFLNAQKERELNFPIDTFFRSLAEYAGSKAISIILSGTGSDGSNGIKAIKENEGMILVQDYESAKFDGMLRSAIRTGLVDIQLSPESMVAELVHIVSLNKKNDTSIKADRQIDNELMKQIYSILKKVTNVNFTHYKQTTILRRLERRMMLTHKEKLEDYIAILYENSEEVKILSKELLIGVTSFFRDPDFFQILKDKIIQDIILRSTIDDPIRIWVAGCSTGEEAYSIAIICREVLESLTMTRSVKIFATDLDVEAVTVAGKGVYGDSIIESVSPARLSKFFSRKNNTYVVNRDIRKMIIFSPHNVFQDPPFGKLDLISCRNMLIYFQPVLQNDLFSIFHASLKDRGYLFLGKSEAIGSFTEAFPVIDAVAKIFSHRRDVKIRGMKTVPYLQTNSLDEKYGDANDSVHYSYLQEIENKEDGKIDQTLLEQFMPACLVVNSKNELVHVFGDNTNYVHLPVGKFSNLLFDVITEALKIPVSTLLKESREKEAKVQYKDIAFMGDRTQSVINMTIMPIGRKGADEEQLFAIIFLESNSNVTVDKAIPYEIDKIASKRITDLEQDLADVQVKLDKSIAEQECVNEELQAANEELLTANEELQSSNEELQSVNEELYTVNSEYQQKLTELADLNDDIANFLSSTLIGIIFVDNKLNIRRYTDYVTTEFSVMDHDIGRSLKFISYHFPMVDISDICENVLKTLVPDEREVMTSKNKMFFMRVAPYRSTENKILGCVITLVDVTTQKVGLIKLQNTEEKLTLIQQANEAQTDYLSRITHEVRTPMGVLMGLAKMLKTHMDDKESLSSNIDKIMSTVAYMASLISDISEVSKEERSKCTIMEPFILRKMLANIYSIVEKEVMQAGLVFEISLDDVFNPTYIGSETALQQILINFINNSIKYTPRGGAISLKVYEEKVEDSKVTLVFVIRDTGIGIRKDFIPELFKPFTRAEQGDKNESESMGLGLSIAYNLIKAMNGDVTVASEINNGSTFTISINLLKDTSTDVADDLNKEASLDGLNVLMAEDNAMNRMILGALLNQEKINYVEVVDGEKAIKAFLDSPPFTYDAILMDMRMPNVDGIQATIKIRESNKEDAKSIPIIGVSANGFSDDIKQALNAGLNSYIVKPIDRDILLKTLKKIVQRKNLQK